MHWGWAIVGGLGGATVIVGLFAWDRAKSWQRRALEARQVFESRGTAIEVALTSQGDKFRNELVAEGRRLAESAARAEAERVLGLEYGLTPERIAEIQRLYTRLGS